MRLFFAIIIALSSAFVFTDGAEFSFLHKKYDFPDTAEGVILKHDYIFTNTGNQPLIIANYKVACSCTTIDYPRTPILPQQTDTLHLMFDTTGKYGFQSRKILIFSNASKVVKLNFRVFVTPRSK